LKHSKPKKPKSIRIKDMKKPKIERLDMTPRRLKKPKKNPKA
jgi:hypothetical protein